MNKTDTPAKANGAGRAQHAITAVKALLPQKIVNFAVNVKSGQVFKPSPNTLDWGDLRRLSPMSRKYGYDRGEPIDRYFIEKFLNEQQSNIHGKILEVSEDTYSRKYGGDKVESVDVLHYDDPTPPVTVIGDLTDAPHLPSNHYDCVIVTQTLMLIYDVPAAIETLHRILKPGGTVLVTVAGLTQIADPAWLHTWHWGFTYGSTHRLFNDGFPDGEVKVQTYGNVLTTIGFMHGLASEELTQEELDHHDPEYQMLVAISAKKKL